MRYMVSKSDCLGLGLACTCGTLAASHSRLTVSTIGAFQESMVMVMVVVILSTDTEY
jgi:hypothetical protein